MGPHRIVMPSPLLDDDLCFLEGVKDLAVEQLISELAVKAFIVTVLPGAPWFDVKRLDAHTPSHFLRALAMNSGPLSDLI